MIVSLADVASAQLAPTIGYVSPPGGAAGQTVDVVIGGYDWTPDMQVFVHDPRIKLEIVGPPGPVTVPEPPYWFGKKARRAPHPLPREFPARLTIPADVPPGVVTWQAANANGATPYGRFVVGHGQEVAEVDARREPQDLPSLPVTVSGQVKKIEEVDRYRFRAETAGLITCRTAARFNGSELTAAVEIHDDSGRLVADAADTTGEDLAFAFRVEAGRSYTVSLYDVDFCGDRSFVYRLSLAPGPLVVAAIPTTGTAGSTQSVEFVGYGVATGAPVLESVKRDVAFPAGESARFDYRLETSHGRAAPFPLRTSPLAGLVEPHGDARRLTAPALVTGVLGESYGEDRYTFSAKKGETWSITVESQRLGSKLDVAVAILDAAGTEVARGDDLTDSTDAALAFTPKADGDYTIAVTDVSGRSGNRAAVYQLELKPAEPDFELSVPELLALPLGGTANLAVKVTRAGGFKDAIPLTIEGLPAGVSPPEMPELAAGQAAVNLALKADPSAATAASLVKLTATATIDGQTVRREAGPVLVALTIPPPFSIDAEGKDDVTKWPRGTTFPAPVLIERNEGFAGEIVLEMTSKQGRHRMGIRGPDITVPPGVNRMLYPVFLPEWLETTRTSRMVVNGVAQVADPKGNVRYSLVKQKTRMGFLPVGALLKISAEPGELIAAPGARLTIPVSIARSQKLTEPLELELSTVEPESQAFTAEPLTLGETLSSSEITIAVADAGVAPGEYRLTLRATALQDGQYPVISETSFLVTVQP